MVICGIKITHDGGLALIDNGTLKFSIEMEKIDNNPRHSGLSDLSIIPKLLAAKGYRMEQIDQFVVDGWHGSGTFWSGLSGLKAINDGTGVIIKAAPYNEKSLKENILKRFFFEKQLPVGKNKYDYSSYMHGAGHIASTYCTSPFAKNKQSSYILIWDGGQYPRLYYFNASTNVVNNLGHLFLFLGTIYSVFSQYFGPYKKTEAELDEERKRCDDEGFFGGFSVAGKIMSYIALGKPRPELLDVFESIRKENLQVSNEFVHIFSKKIKLLVDPEIYSDEDLLATMHVYIENLLLIHLKKKIEQYPYPERNFCFSGGCALNIKWNSAIRNSGLFTDMYVPPFPNDSGSAIGAACCEFMNRGQNNSIGWSVYGGPDIEAGDPSEDWMKSKCSIAQLAEHLHASGEPVVFLHGPAELGPRALGHRSIIAPPTQANMKDILNKVKKRESYRPVAPICLEDRAGDIFDPGCKDPFMLFDHRIKDEWKSKIPAVCHIDGTARLQTINEKDNGIFHALLSEYYKLSDIPLLCNTSANLNGSGFFPSVESATRWSKLNYVWCNYSLYSKKSKVDLSSI